LGDLTKIREFYGPTDKWHGYNGMGAYAYIFQNPQPQEAVYYIISSMISDFGTSAFTHETTHINDRMAYLGTWRHREGTDIIELNSKEDTLVINSLKPIGFDVHNYTIKALEKAKHWNELETIDEVILHIDAKHSGLGSNSCGEEQTYKNKVRLNDYNLNLTFEF